MKIDYALLKKECFMRQAQDGLFSLRLKVVGGNLTSSQLLKIAGLADKYGDGHVHLTSRQGVEIPFVRYEDIDAIKAEMAGGDVSNGSCGPRVRTVTACQGNAVCGSGCIDTYALALEISDRYFGRHLPHKFKLGVTGCMNNCLKAEENDFGVKGALITRWVREDCVYCGVCADVCRQGAISVGDGQLSRDKRKCNDCGRCVKACPTGAWLGEPAYIACFGGTFGNHIKAGKRVTPIFRDKEALLRAADAALDFFDAHGRPGERFRMVIERVGWDALRDALAGVSYGEN